MATKKSVKKISFFDFSSWNFIIFLLLGFVLIVVVATSLQAGAINLGVQAGFVCPNIRLKDPRGCPAGWKVDFKSGRCPVLICPVPLEGTYAPQPTGMVLPTGSSGRMRIPPNEPVVR